LSARLAEADFPLLGEIHDNPAHHQARGELLATLPARFRSLVLEQLDQGRSLDPRLPLDDTLDQAGFNRRGWDWPLHAPVIAAGRERNMAIVGGNLSREAGRALVKTGKPALEPALAAMMDAAPLDEAARRGLEGDLAAGHCGKLPARHLPNMALAQRARDASLARALLAAGGPAVLIAGNGHVRRDYGVPSLLAGQRTLSVGFLEAAPGERPDPAPWRGVFDFLWFTVPAERDDPCADVPVPQGEP
jgi:uncharacterized iron-regulated protein